MKTIKLSRGKEAIVDDDDYDYLMQWSWYSLWNGRSFYAAGSEYLPDGTMEHFLMHRVIMRAQIGEFVDHRNRNALDNRKQNLRRSSKSQNAMNAGMFSHNTTGFKGVSKTRNGTWRSTIQLNSKTIHIGTFPTPTEAAMRYDEQAVRLFGEFANTNKSMGLIE